MEGNKLQTRILDKQIKSFLYFLLALIKLLADPSEDYFFMQQWKEINSNKLYLFVCFITLDHLLTDI